MNHSVQSSISSCAEGDDENINQLPESCQTICCPKEIISTLPSIVGSSSKSSNENENVTNLSSESAIDKPSKNPQIRNSRAKMCSKTMENVSDPIGKDYIIPRSQSVGSNEKEKELASSSSGESLNGDTEDLVLRLLRDGFQLDTNVIQDVLGKCGHNVPKSIDKLLDLSAESLEKSDDVLGKASENADTAVDEELVLSEPQEENENIRSEILDAIFRVPDRVEEKNEPTVPFRSMRSSPYGTIVTKPPEESFIEDFTFITTQPLRNKSGEANESSYEELREAVKENWKKMRRCYKAAVDEFIKDNYRHAELLMEQGKYFMKKAQEADEKSTLILINEGDEEIFFFNVHYLEPKEALKMVKLNFKNFAGLPSISHFKVVVGTGDADNRDDKRRKRLITKLLEKEGIQWTEEGNGWTISIEVSYIDPTKLSFAQK
ncbi:putative nuclear RNA export factor SDE5 [Andrographis paniculata]|uniref:putative nuclear RNA export factor SDE5 n=1 Tax=Andrographis paniculata TaxID=175694 RepID=UPI0021E96132|nr:putative nuclear RNA export factor SDE5 [Andrographis paniculata]